MAEMQKTSKARINDLRRSRTGFLRRRLDDAGGWFIVTVLRPDNDSA